MKQPLKPSKNTIFSEEERITLFGVECRRMNRIFDENNGLFVNQTIVAIRPYNEEGFKKGSTITVELRFDDHCRNGHQDFTITGHVQEPGMRDWSKGGCIHEDIAKYFPKLAHLIQWHLVSTDGPMHYPGNVTYLAGNLDCWGLLKGESRQLVNGKTGKPSWKLAYVDKFGNEVEAPAKYLDGDEQPACPVRVAYVPWCRIGEGKERELDAARRVAAWPEATDEQLRLPKAELEALLMARLPDLLARFKADMESIGMLWRERSEEA